MSVPDFRNRVECLVRAEEYAARVEEFIDGWKDMPASWEAAQLQATLAVFYMLRANAG